MIFKKTHKYRAYPTKAQISRIENQFSMCRHLYNWALADRIWLYENCGVSINYNLQQNELPLLKAERPWYKSVHSQVLQNVLKRLDLSYQAFFRRVKEGSEAPGFPRFKKYKQWDSVTYPQYSLRPTSDIIKVSKIGDLKIQYHREIPVNAKIKTLSIVKEAGKWFVCFSFEQELEIELNQTPTSFLGIDLGLNDFYYDSDGNSIVTPKHLRKSEKKLAKLQRKLARAPRRTTKYLKILRAIRKCHYRIKCQRNDFLHKAANDLLSKTDVIVVEKLNIKNMTKKSKAKKDPDSDGFLPNGASAKAGLNKSISDAGWGKFLTFLKYKADLLGKQVVDVNPAYTSQICSGCGKIVKKTLSVRTHKCPHCKLVLNRDHNAAINLLRLGLQSLGLSQEASTIALA
jgi:putative transposase